MKISEVISLLKAGYSKKEIEELRTAETVVTPAIEDVSEKPAEKAAPQQETAAAAQPVQDNSEVLQAIKDLTKVIQAQNIRNDAIEVKHDSAVDILGSIINTQKGV